VLLLATTNQLSQDVAAGPFLWVLPLALYLLSFIFTFDREKLYPRNLWVLVLAACVVGVIYGRSQGPRFPLVYQLLASSGALLAGCMVCHGELYRLRPTPRHLSAFYLYVSVGGVLGGAIVSLVAPRYFNTYAEYPLALMGCCLVAVLVFLSSGGLELSRLGKGLRVSVLLCLVLGLVMMMVGSRHEVRLTARNFFGVVQVVEKYPDDESLHQYTLKHGAITHGVQLIAPELRAQPTAYYLPGAGLSLAIAEHRRLREVAGQPAGLRIGVLGLGIGTTAALAKEADTVRFYDINPKVISLARGEGGFFSFLSTTKAKVEVVEGDARIALEQELERGEPQQFDVLALDVFSSDSIPLHLLTEEAVALYRKHLAPRGVLVLHISNLHLDLLPISLAHAQAFKMHATHVVTKMQWDGLSSKWVILSPEAEFSWGKSFLETDSQVSRLELDEPASVTWTDELSSVLPVLKGRTKVTVREYTMPPSSPAVAQPPSP
jgi:SAM-dependent methyltransferase/FtsH-binding integral membrane protein